MASRGEGLEDILDEDEDDKANQMTRLTRGSQSGKGNSGSGSNDDKGHDVTSSSILCRLDIMAEGLDVILEEDEEEEENVTITKSTPGPNMVPTSSLSTPEEEALKFNDITRNGVKNSLKKKQDMEKDYVDLKFHQDIIELDQEMEEQEKQLADQEKKVAQQKKKLGLTKKRLADKKEEKRKETEAILKRHRDENTALDLKLGKEQDYDKNAVAKLKEKTNKLGKDLQNLLLGENGSKDTDSLEAARATLECPICMEMMKPPTKIWMCSSSHIVCEPCKNKLKGNRCPTCWNLKVAWRAHFAENLARTVFDDAKIQVTVIPDKSLLFDSDDDLEI